MKEQQKMVNTVGDAATRRAIRTEALLTEGLDRVAGAYDWSTDRAADALSTVSDGVQAAGEGLGTAGRAARRRGRNAARTLSRGEAYLRAHDGRDLTRSVRRTIQDNRGWITMATAVVGVAVVARMLSSRD